MFNFRVFFFFCVCVCVWRALVGGNIVCFLFNSCVNLVLAFIVFVDVVLMGSELVCTVLPKTLG